MRVRTITMIWLTAVIFSFLRLLLYENYDLTSDLRVLMCGLVAEYGAKMHQTPLDMVL